MIFQIFLLDVKGKVLISRNYRGEIDSNVIDKFMPLLMEKGESMTGPSIIPMSPRVLILQRKKAW